MGTERSGQKARVGYRRHNSPTPLGIRTLVSLRHIARYRGYEAQRETVNPRPSSGCQSTPRALVASFLGVLIALCMWVMSLSSVLSPFASYNCATPGAFDNGGQVYKAETPRGPVIKQQSLSRGPAFSSLLLLSPLEKHRLFTNNIFNVS